MKIKIKMFTLILLLFYVYFISIVNIFTEEVIEVESFNCGAFDLTPEKLTIAINSLKSIKT